MDMETGSLSAESVFLWARLAASKPRPGFYSRHCRVSRNYVAIETSARYPPAVAGPLPGRDDARLAAGRSRFELYLRHCRDTRDFVSNDTTARCPPAVAGAPAESKTRPGFYSWHCRGTRIFVAIETSARYPPAVAGRPGDFYICAIFLIFPILTASLPSGGKIFPELHKLFQSLRHGLTDPSFFFSLAHI